MKVLRIVVLQLFIAAQCFANFEKRAIKVLREQILEEATWALQQQPITVTAASSPRSAGGKHDFYSEGDYWWPDPNNPSGPYIQKDGLTNPENFVAHRQAMIRFSRIIGALASAYKITGDEKFVRQAMIHLKAWFVDDSTLMNPNLLYAQAIQGRFTGRGIGIIDTIHLIEVVQGIMVMEQAKEMEKEGIVKIRKWFSDYLTWLTSHPYGKDEMNAENNHGTCWVMQVSAFAKFTKNTALLAFCKDRFKNVLLPRQMAANGSFPLELKRTKPYGYSIFNLDAMVATCTILSDANDNLFHFRLADGRGIKKGIEFLFPYIKKKTCGPMQKTLCIGKTGPWHNLSCYSEQRLISRKPGSIPGEAWTITRRSRRY
ncbi:alginate lyase family protein [Desertivirga brevis]|uniref:alginate lyase family protein n=1 Tax=Desertivirga brevis TaxID=2810310 RepID=UPI001F61CF2A|nr:alginate lyase family protein [Pedobacter sp. SYSU D00873]